MHQEASALQMHNRSFAGQMAAPSERDLSSHLIYALEVLACSLTASSVLICKQKNNYSPIVYTYMYQNLQNHTRCWVSLTSLSEYLYVYSTIVAVHF